MQPVDGDGHAAADEDEGRRAPEPSFLRLGEWCVFATPSSRNGRGRVLARFTAPGGRTVPLLEQEDGRLEPPFDLEEAYRNYLSEGWLVASTARRLSTRQLAAFYRIKRLVPRSAQVGARRALVRWQGAPSFPRWPLDEGVRRLTELYLATLLARLERAEVEFRWFWPVGFEAALVLSHDVESEEGIRLAVELADLEESLGFRSAFNFGAWYDVDPGVLRELTSRGFEVGLHGIVHDRSLFSSRREFERQLPLLRQWAQLYGAVGFRSPSTHRRFEWLAELPLRYDGTIPHSDPYEPQPGGCCSLWPFFVGDIVELPYTLPQDHTLLTLLGHRTPALWIETARLIEDRFGLIHCISHPDAGYLGNAAKRAIYADFLRALAERKRVWHALPAEVAGWWRTRDGAAANGRIALGRAVRDPGTAEAHLVAPTYAT